MRELRRLAAAELQADRMLLGAEGEVPVDIAVNPRTGVCVPACPENVDPKMMMRLARMTALGGREVPKQIDVKQDPDYFNRVRAFAKLQLTDDELKEWT